MSNKLHSAPPLLLADFLKPNSKFKMGCGGSVTPQDLSVKATTSSALEKSINSVDIGHKPRKSITTKLKNPSGNFTRFINEQSPHVRQDLSTKAKQLKMTGETYEYNLNYCYVSQRGYYPHDLDKANQDSYVVCENLLGDVNSHVFGVFDGHGEFGDYCSYFAAEQFPVQFVSELHGYGGTQANDINAVYHSHTTAFVNTNNKMHRADFDDTLSGTTGITVFISGDQLVCANVGDSRAIIARKIDGKLRASHLSNDQTPFRKDERTRLKKAGAKIMTLEQIEGNEPMHENWGTELGAEIDEVGDPPRVWDETLEKPGCAFTRSLGDSVAESCGVFAEPELLHWGLSPDDQFIVIASDGVFEFITSQNVVDMVSKFKDPLEAAKHVVSEAYRLWLTYDDRTDDITCIIITIDGMVAKAGSASGSNSPRIPTKTGADQAAQITRTLSGRLDGGDEIERESRPVRKVLSKARRQEIFENWDEDEEGDHVVYNVEAMSTPKSPEDMERISKMLNANFMFADLSVLQKEQIASVCKARDVNVDELIIKEGDKGDEMYLVDSGEFSVQKEGHEIFSYTDPGSAFGELSLMYGKPRGASVVAITNGKLWCIDRAAFRGVVMKGKQEGGLLKVFRNINLLADLSYPQLQRLCSVTKVESFNKGDILLESEESCPWAIGVIKVGTVRCIYKDESKKRQLRADYAYVCAGEMFKFRSITADSAVKLVTITKAALQEISSKQINHVDMLLAKSTKIKYNGKKQEAGLAPVYMDADNIDLNKLKKSDYENLQADGAILHAGSFAYVGNFTDTNTRKRFSIKLIAKDNAGRMRMTGRLLQERNILAAYYNTDSYASATSCVAHASMTYTTKKICCLLFTDLFVCDLGLAISNAAILPAAKSYYAACMYNAVNFVHESGLIHRFLNPGSFYITTNGVPKVRKFTFMI